MSKLAKWSHLFTNAILQRGRDYYHRKLVRNLKEEDNRITGRVGQDTIYDVSITYDYDGLIRSMSCSCPYAEDGKACKHEAALLYAYENRDVRQPDEKTNPFENDFRSGNYYYNLYKAVISADLRITTSNLNSAVRLLNEEKLELDTLEQTYASGQQAIKAAGFFMEADSYVYAEVEVGKEKLLNYYCDNRRCQNSLSRFSYMFWNSGSSELCPHLLALLLLVAEYIKKYNPGDSTDYSGLRLLQNFAGRESSVLSDQEQIRHDIRLEPRLTHEGNGLLKLSFRMGNERLFNVRNLTDMVKAHDGKEEFALSTKASVDFSQNDFEAHSDRYFQLIAEAVSEENNRKLIRTRDYHAGDDSKLFNIGSSLLLYGRRLDDFYELAKDEIIELTDNAGGWKEKHEITLKKGRPEMNLTVSDVWTNRDFDGVRMEGTVPGIIQGAKHGYYVTTENLVQVDPDYLQLVEMLQHGSRGDKIDVRIGRKHLPEFYHHVLPHIKDKAVVYENNRSMIEEYIPPKPEYHFYLDAVQGQITCRAMVSYGDNMYNMTDIDPALEFRDPISENRVYETLNRYFEGVSEQNELICSKEDDAIFDLLENGIPELLKLGEVQSTSAFDRLKVKRRIGLQVGVRLSNDLLELDITTDDISLEELAEVINSYRQKKKFHRLRNGEFVRIDDENVESLDELLESMNISLKDFVAGKMNIPAYRALYLDHLLEKNEYLYDHRDSYYRNLLKDFKTIRDSEYEVPESLKEVIRGYQKDGFRWLKTLDAFGFGGILADEMGLGKTVQMISLLLDHKESGKKGISLVVCPASLIFNWQNEFRKFAPQMNTICVTGTQNERKDIIERYQECDVLITSYDLLKRDIDLYEDIVFDCEILDEAQYIKTHTTANAKACKAINAARHFALTGTPIENNLSELWSIFDFLMPGFLYGYQAFRNRFELRIAKDNNDKVAEELKQMISPFILRRKKMDVLTDLPEKIEETVKVKFDAEQQRLYDSQVLKMTQRISNTSEENFNKEKIEILAELTRIRQICCEPGLLFEDYDGESAKKSACMELISSAIEEGHKILLFSQFTSMLEVLEEQLKEKGILYYKLTGQTKKEDRIYLVDSFNNDDVPVFLISLKAGGTGLNLTGADIVIHYDPWWNVAAQNQATDRAHRIGQDKIVTVYRIIAEGTIEEKIVELQEKKSDLAENLLGNDTVSIATLRKEDLLRFLKI